MRDLTADYHSRDKNSAAEGRAAAATARPGQGSMGLHQLRYIGGGSGEVGGADPGPQYSRSLQASPEQATRSDAEHRFGDAWQQSPSAADPASRVERSNPSNARIHEQHADFKAASPHTETAGGRVSADGLQGPVSNRTNAADEASRAERYEPAANGREITQSRASENTGTGQGPTHPEPAQKTAPEFLAGPTQSNTEVITMAGDAEIVRGDAGADAITPRGPFPLGGAETAAGAPAAAGEPHSPYPGSTQGSVEQAAGPVSEHRFGDAWQGSPPSADPASRAERSNLADVRVVKQEAAFKAASDPTATASEEPFTDASPGQAADHTQGADPSSRAERSESASNDATTDQPAAPPTSDGDGTIQDRQPIAAGPPDRQPIAAGPPDRQPIAAGPPDRQPIAAGPSDRQPNAAGPQDRPPAPDGDAAPNGHSEDVPPATTAPDAIVAGTTSVHAERTPPPPAAEGHSAPYNKQLRNVVIEGEPAIKEHIVPGAQLQALTTDPTTGQSDYRNRVPDSKGRSRPGPEYLRDEAVVVREGQAAEKTHRHGETLSDNRRTADIKQSQQDAWAGRGEGANLNRDLVTPSIARSTEVGIDPAHSARGALGQLGNLFDLQRLADTARRISEFADRLNKRPNDPATTTEANAGGHSTPHDKVQPQSPTAGAADIAAPRGGVANSDTAATDSGAATNISRAAAQAIRDGTIRSASDLVEWIRTEIGKVAGPRPGDEPSSTVAVESKTAGAVSPGVPKPNPGELVEEFKAQPDTSAPEPAGTANPAAPRHNGSGVVELDPAPRGEAASGLFLGFVADMLDDAMGWDLEGREQSGAFRMTPEQTSELEEQRAEARYQEFLRQIADSQTRRGNPMTPAQVHERIENAVKEDPSPGPSVLPPRAEMWR